MAKWEENTKWSKINFLISVFFFFPWINISMKDNEWPFKSFRGRIIPPLCPLNVDMLVNWKKEAFCLNFSNELVFSSFFCVNNMSLWDMLGKTMLFKGMRRKIKKYRPTSLFTYLFYLSIFCIRPNFYSIDTFFWHILTAWDYHQ